MIFIAGFIAAFGLLFTEIVFRPPLWLDALIWLPIAAACASGCCGRSRA